MLGDFARLRLGQFALVGIDSAQGCGINARFPLPGFANGDDEQRAWQAPAVDHYVGQCLHGEGGRSQHGCAGQGIRGLNHGPHALCGAPEHGAEW